MSDLNCPDGPALPHASSPIRGSAAPRKRFARNLILSALGIGPFLPIAAALIDLNAASGTKMITPLDRSWMPVMLTLCVGSGLWAMLTYVVFVWPSQSAGRGNFGKVLFGTIFLMPVFAAATAFAMYHLVWRAAEISLFDHPGTRWVARWYPVRIGPQLCQLTIEPGPIQIFWKSDCAFAAKVHAAQNAAGAAPFGPSGLCYRVPVEIAGHAERIKVSNLEKASTPDMLRACS